MSFAFIREGDTTSHGGRVLACDPSNLDNGKAIALLGDMVSCPRCDGVFPIVGIKEALAVTFNGRPVASEGDVTACGASLIASQSVTTASPSQGAGGSIGGGRQVVAHKDGVYRGRFQLVDDRTRMPLANHSYTITSAHGATIEGVTDANGLTDWLDSRQASSLAFHQQGPTIGVNET